MRRPSHRRHNHSWPRLHRWLPAWVSVQSMVDILKHLYVSKPEPEMVTPWFATLAYERHWISGKAYSAIPKVPTGRVIRPISDLLNEPSPLWGLIKAHAS